MSLTLFGRDSRRLSLGGAWEQDSGKWGWVKQGGLSHLGRGRLYLEVGWVG